MMTDPLAALRQAAEAVRAQIPAGELTRASVERLLQAAEAVCADANLPRAVEDAPSPPASKRQEARRKWAQVARRNASEGRHPLPAAE